MRSKRKSEKPATTRPTTIAVKNVANQIHPAEIDHLTCFDLHRLSKAIGSSRRELSFISQDLTRETHYNKTMLYLLDYSELHAYLWPETSKSQHKVLTRYLLTETKLNFALPPGAVRELIYKLSRQVSEHKRKRGVMGDLLARPIIQAFLRSYEAPFEQLNWGAPAVGKVIEEVIKSVNVLREDDDRLDRLARLYDTGRLRPLSFWVDPQSVFPDPEILQDAYYELTSSRPTRSDTVNYVDAHNYAVTFALNKAFYNSSNLFFLLITSSDIPYKIFESMKWMDDPLFTADSSNIIRTPLVRHPVHLLYYSFLAPQGAACTKLLGAAKKDLAALHESWSSLSLYNRYLRGEIAGQTRVRLPRNRSYRKHLKRFSDFYRSVYRPINELLSSDTAQEENRRLLRRVDRTGIGGVYQLDSHDEENISTPELSYRSIIALFDRLLNLTENLIGRAVKSVSGFHKAVIADVDPAELVVKPDRLSLKSNFNREVGCTEFSVYITSPGSKEHQIYLSADSYSDYVSFWWRTNIDFGEFIKAMKTFVRDTARWMQASGEEGVQKEKAYLGTYFYLDNDVKRFALEDMGDLSSASLLDLCEPQWHIQFVRLGLDYADIIYDFEPMSPFPQRVGVITHLNCVAPIADFVRWTHSKYVQREAIRKVIRGIFQSQHASAASAATQ